jgi:phosphate transport system protein
MAGAQWSLGEKRAVPRIHFQIQLAELKDKLLAMAALAQQAVESAVDAYIQRDKSLCQFVKQNETAIDSAQRELDEMAYELLAKEQPMAIDLRFILSVIRINADLERVGDQAVNIAVRVREMGAFANIDLPVDIPKLASLASAMVRIALQAFIEADADLAKAVLKMDDEVDEMNDAAFYALSSLIKERPELTPQSLNALIISRNLERVGDHATNIAEDVIFWVRGADVRHHSNSDET